MGSTILMTIALCCVLNYGAADKVSRVGNEIQASLSGVDVPGATFLQRDIILTDGVLFAYSAYFRSNKPVSLQVWRPETTNAGETSTYKLLAQTRVIPSTVLNREDIYIESRITEKCVRVGLGDRLGVFLEDSPGSISYVFDPSSPTALGHRLSVQDDMYTVGDVITFDPLVFPYDFSVAAYIDTDESHYANVSEDLDFVDCYSHVLIPEYAGLDTLTTTTTAPPTGAPGATGPAGAMGPQGEQGPAGNDGAVGPQGEAGAAGANGLPGSDGAQGETGPKGDTGLTGATGQQGPKGERGDVGPSGSPGEIIYVSNMSDPRLGQSENGGPFALFAKPVMSMSYLIWLIALTVAVIVLIIVIVIVARRRHQHQQSDDFGRVRFPSLSVSEQKPASATKSWMDDLKDETETTYSNDTLQKNLDTNNRDSAPEFTYEHETKVPEFMY